MKERNRTWKTPSALWRKMRSVSSGMRSAPTGMEDKFWQAVKGKRLGGFKFRRQHPIDRFIVDFYVPEKQLVIELDGEIHQASQEADLTREDRLSELGCDILRFTNDQVENDLDEVLEKVKEKLEL